MMRLYLWVTFGGALGSAARFLVSGWVANRFGQTFPWGTLLVNVTGCFLIGFFATLTDPAGGRVFAGATARQFFMTGICGGYTTFSSFSLQTLNLARDGEWLQAGGNIAGSVFACLLAVWLGFAAAAWLNHWKGA
ncbi:MAG TPA: fluoride efflux transporter CrcB [Opitutaceae bacterium]|nr:fluoride efflux transporter CrcB [Opitutaceae bacterium]